MENKEQKNYAKEFASKGGRASVQARLGRLTPEQVSEEMRKLRMMKSTPEEDAFMEKIGEATISALKKIGSQNIDEMAPQTTKQESEKKLKLSPALQKKIVKGKDAEGKVFVVGL